jgi:hypothetical protein
LAMAAFACGMTPRSLLPHDSLDVPTVPCLLRHPSFNKITGGGANIPGQQHAAASVQGTQAFVDPATLSEFVNFVRQKGDELKARALISIVPKSAVAFPQVRRNG